MKVDSRTKLMGGINEKIDVIKKLKKIAEYEKKPLADITRELYRALIKRKKYAHLFEGE